MSAVIIVIDGASEEDYNGLIASSACVRKTMASHTPKGMKAESLCCMMRLFGAPDEMIPEGRSYLEALSLGLNVGDDDLVLRANGVNISHGKLVSSWESNQMGDLPKGYEFYPIGSYKNLLIARGKRKAFSSLVTFPPHENLQKQVNRIKAKCDDSALEQLLNELPGMGFFPWGQSVKTDFSSFYELHHKSAAVVCKTEIVAGLAKAMDMYCPDIPQATAETDTNLVGKKEAALKLSRSYDYIFVHINGADEAAHRQNPKEKADFIRKIDEAVVAPLLADLPAEIGLVVTSDHITDAASSKHSERDVPAFYLRECEETKNWERYL